MLSSFLPLSLTIFLATSLVSAVPTPNRSAKLETRQASVISNDPGCVALITRCASLAVPCTSSGTVIVDAWSYPACLLGASCYAGNTDAFLDLVVLIGTGLNVNVQSLNTPRVSVDAFKSISTNVKVITEADWVNAWYRSIGALGAGGSVFPWPVNSNAVKGYFQAITSWAGVCNGAGVPVMNFGDYFEYSASVQSNQCPTVTAAPKTVAPAAVTSAVNIIAAVNPVVPASSTSYTFFYNNCVSSVSPNLQDIWTHDSCVLAAAGFQTSTSGVQAFVNRVNSAKNGGNGATTPNRLTASQFASLSSNGNVISQQNWIDAWYGQLTAQGASYPADTSGAIAAYKVITNWTGNCQASGVSYGSFADFFTYYNAPYGSVNGCPTP